MKKMKDEGIRRYYFFSVTWIIYGLFLITRNTGLMKDMIGLSCIIIGICAAEFFVASQEKVFLLSATIAIIGIWNLTGLF